MIVSQILYIKGNLNLSGGINKHLMTHELV